MEAMTQRHDTVSAHTMYKWNVLDSLEAVAAHRTNIYENLFAWAGHSLNNCFIHQP